MDHASNDVDELKTLQREAAELRESRKRAGSTTGTKHEQSQGSDPGSAAEQNYDSSEDAPQSESGLHDIAEHLEIYLKEIEEGALERPTLALLATFALGVFIGHLFTRR